MSELDAEGLQGEQAGSDNASGSSASLGGSSPDGAGFASTEAVAPRPEMAVGAAFAGGFVLALLLRRVRS